MFNNTKEYFKEFGILLKDKKILKLLLFSFKFPMVILKDFKSMSKKQKVVFLVAIIAIGYIGSSQSGSSSSSSSNSSPYGKYSDFSEWKSGYSGFVNVRESDWEGFIRYQGRVENTFKGKTKGSDLMDEYGMNRLGYVSDGTLYLYYMGGWGEIGK